MVDDAPKKRSMNLPDEVWDGLAEIASRHGRLLRGHGYTGRPNRTWALTYLVQKELKKSRPKGEGR